MNKGESSSRWLCNLSGFESLFVFLDGFEELGEVTFPKPTTSTLLVNLPFLILKHAPYSLNDLYEYGWPAHFKTRTN